MRLNEELIKARKALGLSQAKAAKKIGISPGMLAMLETGKRRGSDRTKIKIAMFYKKSVEELFFKHNLTISEIKSENAG
nr:helix-turn-helix transcriptional regulator [Anoxybacillus tengchongensis]